MHTTDTLQASGLPLNGVIGRKIISNSFRNSMGSFRRQSTLAIPPSLLLPIHFICLTLSTALAAFVVYLYSKCLTDYDNAVQ
jgi:hypothetical protein